MWVWLIFVYYVLLHCWTYLLVVFVFKSCVYAFLCMVVGCESLTFTLFNVWDRHVCYLWCVHQRFTCLYLSSPSKSTGIADGLPSLAFTVLDLRTLDPLLSLAPIGHLYTPSPQKARTLKLLPWTCFILLKKTKSFSFSFLTQSATVVYKESSGLPVLLC